MPPRASRRWRRVSSSARSSSPDDSPHETTRCARAPAGTPMSVHLITGAGSGIGAAVARALHERGDELWLLARSTSRAEELSDAFPGAHTVVADLADPDSLATLQGLPEHLDSLHHIAGVVELEPVASLDPGSLRAQIDVNLVAPMLLTRACLPALRAARGLVVVANSGAGLSASAT